MRKTLALLLLLITGHVGAQVQKALPLGSLTAAGTLSTADLFYVQQGGTDRKATGSQIAALAGSCGLTTKADLCVFGSAPTRLSVGTNGQVLTADSAQTLGLKWATPTTYMTNPMTTAGDVIYGGASGTPTRLAGGTSGYVLTSNGATSAPSWQAASGGSSLTATYIGYGNGSNALTGTSDFSYSTSTGTLSIVKSAADSTSQVSVYNSSATSLANAVVAIGADGGYLALTKNSSVHSTSGLVGPDIATILTGTGGLVIGTNGAVDTIVASGGTASSNEVARFVNASPGTMSLGLAATNGGALKLYGSTSGSATVQPPATAGSGTTITLPGATGTLATLAGSETLTNKSIAGSQLTGAYTSAGMTMATAKVLGRATASSGAVEELATTGTGSVMLAASPTTTGTLTAAAITASGTVQDALGDVRNIIQNSKSAAYTTVLSDCGKQIYHPTADTTARTWTIDSNANVAAGIGCAITFVNDLSAGTLTISITSDTMRLAGTSSTGSRTMTGVCVATALKVTSTVWIISGGSCLT